LQKNIKIKKGFSMNEDDIENRKEKLVEMARELWLSNAITKERLNRVIKLINDGNLDYAERLLITLEIKNNHAEDKKIKSDINNNISLDEYFSIKNGNNKDIDDLIKKCDFFEKTNSILNIENEKEKVTNEKLTVENENLRKIAESLVTENHNIKENINKIQKENLELKKKHQQSRIDEKIPDYVKDVSQKLDVADKFFSDMSRNWSIAGLILALCAVASAFCTFFFGLDTILDNQKLTPTVILYTFVRGGLGIALLSWVSYISFSNARNYTHESILRKDRQHALTFGRLFLQIYGSTASKEDAIHVFKDWNMSGDTAFSSKSSAPPSPLSYLDTIKNALSKASATTKSADKTNE